MDKGYLILASGDYDDIYRMDVICCNCNGLLTGKRSSIEKIVGESHEIL